MSLRRCAARLLLRAVGLLDPQELLAWQWFMTAPPGRRKWSVDPCENFAALMSDGARFCPACHRPAERYNTATDQNELPSPERCLDCGWTPRSLLEVLADRAR